MEGRDYGINSGQDVISSASSNLLRPSFFISRTASDITLGSFFNPGPYSCFLAVGGTVAFDRILEKGGFELQAIVPGYGCFAEGIVVGLGLSSTGGGFFAPE